MSGHQEGRVLSIALRTGDGEPMKLIDQATAIAGGGLDGDIGDGPEGGVRLLACSQWQEVVRSLGTVLLWHASQANVLIHANTLLGFVGRTVRLGEATIEITRVIEPSPEVDEIRPGLRQLLREAGRAGVVGRVKQGGRFAVGDALIIEG